MDCNWANSMIDNFGYIYVYINLINGKKYVGQTGNIKKRLRQHKNSTDTKLLYRSINKYGIENFKIFGHQYPEDKLDEYEGILSEKLNTLKPNGYNLMKPGGKTNKHHHQESIKKMIELKRKNPEQEKQLILNKHPNCIIGDYFYKNHLLCFNILNCGCGHKFDLQMNSFKSRNSWCRECWNKKRKGENNPSAKSYKITSPNNEIFIIKGTLEKFCKENNLCYGMIKRLLYKNYKNDNYKGWKIEYFNK